MYVFKKNYVVVWLWFIVYGRAMYLWILREEFFSITFMKTFLF